MLSFGTFSFASLTLVEKGWSGDRKYRAVTSDGSTYLLRIMPLEKGERFEQNIAMQNRIAALGVPMCETLASGTCSDGYYVIQRWIHGADAEEVFPHLSLKQQYNYGITAGKYLKRIHSIPAPSDIPDWETRFNAKIDRKIAGYNACPIRFEGDTAILTYLAENRHLLKDRPQTYQHGDYHIGNMMIENDTLTIIDFDRYDFGDPWEEFNRIVWCAQKAPHFASGIVDGYFDGDVPLAFWKLLALYIASNTLSSIPWAIPFGEGEINTMLNQAKEILEWYDSMQNVIPTWYQEKADN